MLTCKTSLFPFSVPPLLEDLGRQRFISVIHHVPECPVGLVPRVSHGILESFIVKVVPPEFLIDVPESLH